MKKLIIALIAILIYLHCLPVNSQTIPALITPDGYIFVESAFNDSVRVKLMFDTGSGLCVISSSLYNKLKSTMKPAGLFTGFRHDGERLDAELYSIPKLTIGSHTVYNVKTAVYPPLDNYGIDGILSLKEFEDTPVTVDFKNNSFTIESPQSIMAIETSASAVIPLLLHRNTNVALDAFLYVCFNDSIKVKAEFDTGSGYSTLLVNPYFMKTLGVDSSSAEKTAYITPTEKKNLIDYRAMINSLKYCGADIFSVTNQSVTFRQNIIYEGLIGSGMFKNSLLTIDIPNSRMLVR